MVYKSLSDVARPSAFEANRFKIVGGCARRTNKSEKVEVTQEASGACSKSEMGGNNCDAIKPKI